jgi:hypothetical protein
MSNLEATKYSKWYFNIINKRKQTPFVGYGENHHIIPRSLGGMNESENIVRLTAREHFICHLLLTKMFPKDIRKTEKMIKAWCWMAWNKSGERDYKINSHIFEKLKIQFSLLTSKNQTINNSQHGTRWIHNMRIKQCKKIKNSEIIPEGWVLGRVLNWDIFFIKTKKAEERKKYKDLLQCKFCNKKLIFSNRKKYFCSKTCSNKYFYNTQNLIKIKKGNKVKEVKPMNFPAYQISGWVKI